MKVANFQKLAANDSITTSFLGNDMNTGRSVTNADAVIGERIRSLRLQMNMTQQELGEALGVSFQQLQKYERGFNRVTAARLVEIADLMNVEVGYFIADLGKAKASRAKGTDALARYLATKEGVDIAKAMTKIRSPKVRRSIIDLAETLAD